MLMIRLQRVGRKKDPSYRVVVTEKTRAVSSNNYIERVGSYDTIRKTIALDDKRILHWIQKGAQPSDTVHNLLIREGILQGKTKNTLPKKSPIQTKKKGENENTEKVSVAPTVEQNVEKPVAPVENKEDSSTEDSKKEDSKKEDSKEDQKV